MSCSVKEEEGEYVENKLIKVDPDLIDLTDKDKVEETPSLKKTRLDELSEGVRAMIRNEVYEMMKEKELDKEN